MNKEDFREKLREKLRETPLEVRQTWTKTSLLIWWGETKSQNSYLTWDCCNGDIWQQVNNVQ